MRVLRRLGLGHGGLWALALLLLWLPASSHADDASALELPKLLLPGVPFEIKLDLGAQAANLGASYRVLDGPRDRADGRGDGRVVFDADGRATLTGLRVSSTGQHTLTVEVQGQRLTGTVSAIPGWLSVLPPLLAIGLALWLRQVVLALFSGVWLGALFVGGFDPFRALLRVADHYAVAAVADSSHAQILVFSLLLGGMIGVVTRSGGGLGLASLVTRYATTSRRGQVVTWVMGLLIFFDDYANSLLVGTSMRPITDRLRISREKLSFLVDATSAPVASLALVSSWIGVEVGYISDQYQALGIHQSAWATFIQTIPYRFYPLLMLYFTLLTALMGRDFGPMLTAERRARREGKLLRDGAKPASDFDDAEGILGGKPDWVNAVVPVITVVLVALGGMYLDGRESAGADASLGQIFGAADSLLALTWASLLGGGVALLLAVTRKSLRLEGAMDAWLAGVRSMVLACIILVLAWSLGAVCRDLSTANWVVTGIGPWMPPALLPSVVFLVAAAVSFATGTSWGTMAILFPLVVPLAYQLAGGDQAVMLGGIGSILAGSVWGDHCSPISDTTIMSSMASSCDHVDHVRTQLPYCLAVGVVSLLAGSLPCAMGLPPWAGLLLGALVLSLILRFRGSLTDEVEPPPRDEADAAVG